MSGPASTWAMGVGVEDLLGPWCSVTQDTFIPVRGNGPKDLGKVPQRPGTVVHTCLPVGPKMAPRRTFPGRIL